MRQQAEGLWQRLGVCLPLAGLLGACATPLPASLDVPAEEVSLASVRENPEVWVGTPVRWGGVIARVDNRSDSTRVEIAARRLDSSGRPVEEDHSDGRFVARFPGFRDPAVLARGRDLTVVGRLGQPVDGSIGEYPYRFPVIEVTGHQLWRPRQVHPVGDPFYDPYWHYWPWRHPYYRWGPWRHPYHWHRHPWW